MRWVSKLTIWFLTLSIVPLVGVAYLAYQSGRQSIEQNTFNRLASTTVLKEAEFERWVGGGETLLRLLASRPNLMQDASALAALDPADAASLPIQRRILEQHLRPILMEESGFEALAILRASDGLVLVSTDETLEGKYRESEAYFIEGRRGTYVDQVSYSLSHGESVMHVSTPLSDARGELVVVLVGHADLSEMSDILLQGSGLSASEETYLVNSFNFFVSEPWLGAGLALTRAVHTEGVNACLAQAIGVGYYDDYRGVPVIGAYRWMAEREMCILTEVDQAEAFAPIAAMRNTILGIGAIVALVAALAGLGLSRSITQPLEQLVQGAQEVGEGNMEYQIPVHGRDEIAQLAKAFNAMTVQRKQAQEELEAFSYSVSHDLRAPLRAMDGFSRILAEEYALQLPDEAQRYLGLVRSSAQHMGKLIDDLLAFSRLGRRPLKLQRVLVAKLAREVLKDLRAEQDGRQVEIAIGALPPCRADPTLLRQVYANLLANALKFTRKRTPAVIEVGCQTSNGECVYFVKDNGVGFDMQYADKLFGVFQRLHSAEEFEGTGVGLAIVQRIVHRHGGQIWAEAEIDSGAAFYFRLGGGPPDDGR